MGRAPSVAVTATTAGEPAPALGAAAFAGLMAPLGPFERHPFLAVAVSGGADSLALCLLADGWARERGGTLVALTVDHGLREAAAAEAARVGARWVIALSFTGSELCPPGLVTSSW